VASIKPSGHNTPTLQTDTQDRQQSCSKWWTVTCNGRPKNVGDVLHYKTE